jgi:hypothetical protein
VGCDQEGEEDVSEAQRVRRCDRRFDLDQSWMAKLRQLKKSPCGANAGGRLHHGSRRGSARREVICRRPAGVGPARILDQRQGLPAPRASDAADDQPSVGERRMLLLDRSDAAVGIGECDGEVDAGRFAPRAVDTRAGSSLQRTRSTR